MNPARHDELIGKLTSSQNRLFGFILTLLPDRERARDVLQETNLVIWRRADQYAPGTDFWAWACRIARFQVLSYFRDAGRDRHIFNEAVVERLAQAAEQHSGDDGRRDALADCLAELSAAQRDLIAARYRQQTPLADIASESGGSVASIKMSLMRIRQSLSNCIERKVAGR